MFPRAIVASAALLLATVAMQDGLLQQSEAQSSSDPSISSCLSQSTNGVQEGCTPSFLDTAPGTVPDHEILTGGCAGGDLHVMRYTPHASQTPLVATWCG